MAAYNFEHFVYLLFLQPLRKFLCKFVRMPAPYLLPTGSQAESNWNLENLQAHNSAQIIKKNYTSLYPEMNSVTDCDLELQKPISR